MFRLKAKDIYHEDFVRVLPGPLLGPIGLCHDSGRGILSLTQLQKRDPEEKEENMFESFPMGGRGGK